MKKRENERKQEIAKCKLKNWRKGVDNSWSL